MSWTNPHPYQNDRQARDVVGGRVAHVNGHGPLCVLCVTCSRRVPMAHTVHGGECARCADLRVATLMEAVRRAR